MNTKKIVVASVAGLMLSGVSLMSGSMVASASEVSTQIETTQQQEMSEQTQEIANKYIHFNGTVFLLSDDARSELVDSEFSQVQQQVENTNATLRAITDTDKKMSTLSVVDPNGNQTVISKNLQRCFGKNDIKFYWNFVRIWINARELRTSLQLGFAAGTIFVPIPQLQFACAAAGILSTTYVSSGIGFDFNYAYRRVTKAWIQ